MSDLISRQAAIDAISVALADLHNAYAVGLIRAQKIISELPPAQPERKTGKWKRKIVDSGFNADWICSECGWKTSLEEHGYNFCPNCGADMRGEQDEQAD